MALATPFHGSQARVYANGYDMSTAFQSIESKASCETADATGFAAIAEAHAIGPHIKSELSASGMFDANQSGGTPNKTMHSKISSVLGVGGSIIVHMVRDTTLGDIGFAQSCTIPEYAAKSPHREVVKAELASLSTVGFEPVRALHILEAETAATSKTGIDNAVLSSLGGASYLQVMAVVGTSITIRVQHSSNSTNGIDGVWVDVVTHTAMTPAMVIANTSQERVAIAAGTLNRWTRSIWTGTFSSATFHLALNRK